MKFSVEYTSDWHDERTHEVEFNTLEELIGWCNDQGHSVIVSGTDFGASLEVYDEYRE